MIVGEKSFLKGFGLFLFLVIASIALIGTLITGVGVLIFCGIFQFLISALCVVFLYLYWSKAPFVKGSNVVIKLNYKFSKKNLKKK